MAKSIGQRVRGQMSEIRGKTTADRGREAKNFEFGIADLGESLEDGGQTTEDRRQRDFDYEKNEGCTN